MSERMKSVANAPKCGDAMNTAFLIFWAEGGLKPLVCFPARWSFCFTLVPRPGKDSAELIVIEIIGMGG